jgi:signal transduction histidine kinase
MPPALLLCVEVSDNGDGVDVDDTRLLFQPFYLENDGAL